MKKGYYLVFGETVSVGVTQKIDMQLQVLRGYTDIELIRVAPQKRNFAKKAINFLPWVSNKWDFERIFLMLRQPDYLYIRRTIVDKKYVEFLCKVKKAYPNCKILIEIPTYPYDKYFINCKGIFFLFKDVYNRKELVKCVDRFVTYSQFKDIMGIPTIRVSNGIVVDDIPMKSRKKTNGNIDLIAVANFQKYHGYERIISGMKDYYHNTEEKPIVRLHLVGYGTEEPYYKELVKKNELNNYVFFYGYKSGKELDQVYDQMDIALGKFGYYAQKELGYSSALKIREYLARGLPVISSYYEDILEERNLSFYYRCPNEKKAIDMYRFVDFYQKVYADKGSENQVAIKIRDFAKHEADMSVVLQPVIDYIMEKSVNGK